MHEYIKIIVGIASGLFFTYIFSRAIEYIVLRYFSSIDERFGESLKERKELFQRMNKAESTIAEIQARCEEREKWDGKNRRRKRLD